MFYVDVKIIICFICSCSNDVVLYHKKRQKNHDTCWVLCSLEFNYTVADYSGRSLSIQVHIFVSGRKIIQLKYLPGTESLQIYKFGYMAIAWTLCIWVVTAESNNWPIARLPLHLALKIRCTFAAFTWIHGLLVRDKSVGMSTSLACNYIPEIGSSFFRR